MTLWKEYLQQMWENGKKLVPNPNKTEDSEDFVQMLTAYNKDMSYRAKISHEFHMWLEQVKNENISYMPKDFSIKEEVDSFVDRVKSLKSQPNYQDLSFATLLSEGDFANNAILSIIRRKSVDEDTELPLKTVGDIEKIIDSDQFNYRDFYGLGKIFKNKEYVNFIHKHDKGQQDLFIKLYNLVSNSDPEKEHILTDFATGEQFYEWSDFLSTVDKFSPFIHNLSSVLENLKKDQNKNNLKDLVHYLETGERKGLLNKNKLDYEDLLGILVKYSRARDNFLDENDLDILEQQEQLMTPEESPIEYSIIQQLKQYIKDGPNLFSGYLGAEPNFEVKLPISKDTDFVKISDFVFPQEKKYSISFTNPHRNNMMVSVEEVNLPAGGFKMNMWTKIVIENSELKSGANYVEPLMLGAKEIVGSKLTFDSKCDLLISDLIQKNEIRGPIKISPELSSDNKYSDGDIYIHKTEDSEITFERDSLQNNRIHYILEYSGLGGNKNEGVDKEITFKESNLSRVELVAPKTSIPISRYSFENCNLYGVNSNQTKSVELRNSNVDKSSFFLSYGESFFLRNSNIKDSVFSRNLFNTNTDLMTLNFRSKDGSSSCENCVFNYAEIFGHRKDMDFTNCIFFNCDIPLLAASENQELMSKNTFINSNDIFSFYTEGGISIEDIKNNINNLENLGTHTREIKEIEDRLKRLDKEQREAVRKHKFFNRKYPQLNEIIEKETERYNSGQKIKAEDIHPELASVIKEFKEVTSELKNNADQIESFKKDLEFHQSEKSSFNDLLLDIHPGILKGFLLNYKNINAYDEGDTDKFNEGDVLYDKIIKYAARKNIVIGENVFKKNTEHTKTVDDYYNWENKFWK